MNHLEKVDFLIDVWLEDIITTGDVPTDEQIKLLSKLRDTFSTEGKKRFDIRLTSMTDDQLLDMVNGSSDTEEGFVSTILDKNTQ